MKDPSRTLVADGQSVWVRRCSVCRAVDHRSFWGRREYVDLSWFRCQVCGSSRAETHLTWLPG